MAAQRGSRRRAAGFVFMVLALVAAAVSLGYGRPPEFSQAGGAPTGRREAATVSIQIAGVAWHPAWRPPTSKRSRVHTRIANEGLWPHEISAPKTGRSMSDPESRRRPRFSRLNPGTPASSASDGPGDYYLVPGNTWHFLSGLRGQVRVEQPVDMPAAHRRANVRP